MSGGHFDYKQYEMQYIAEGIADLIEENNYSPETIEEFKRGLHYLKMATLYVQRIDWLVSGDDGEETFHQLIEVGKKMIGDYDGKT